MMGAPNVALRLEDTENDLLQNMLKNQEYSAVTLIAEDGMSVQAHRVVLSTCSDFFKMGFR